MQHLGPPISISLKSSTPNLISNNLAVGRDRLAYAHSQGASTVTHGGRDADVTYGKIETKDLAYTYSIQSCYSLGGWVIVLTSSVGLQIWNSTGQLMILNYEHVGRAHEGPAQWRASCAAGVQSSPDAGAVIVAGTSHGELLLFSLDVPSGIAKSTGKQAAGGGGAVTALKSCIDSSRGREASDVVATGDESGGLCLWSHTPDGLVKKAAVEGGEFGPVVGIALRNGRVIAGFSSGTVTVLSQDSLEPELRLFAHSRLLSGMDIHPTRDIFATVAEDCTLNVWSLPTKSSPEAGPLLSKCLPSTMLTGVAFCGPDNNDVAVSAYDHTELKVFQGV